MEVTIGFATAASGTAIEDRGGGERGARKDPFFAAQCQFHSESPFQDIVRPTMGTLAARKGEREEGGRAGRGGEGRVAQLQPKNQVNFSLALAPKESTTDSPHSAKTE